MDSFKREFELEKVELSNKNIGLFLAKEELEDLLAEKKDELLQMKDDLVLVQKILMEKDFLLQEAELSQLKKSLADARLVEQISKTSNNSKHNEMTGSV